MIHYGVVTYRTFHGWKHVVRLEHEFCEHRGRNTRDLHNFGRSRHVSPLLGAPASTQGSGANGVIAAAVCRGTRCSIRPLHPSRRRSGAGRLPILALNAPKRPSATLRFGDWSSSISVPDNRGIRTSEISEQKSANHRYTSLVAFSLPPARPTAPPPLPANVRSSELRSVQLPQKCQLATLAFFGWTQLIESKPLSNGLAL
jgi:hypothetical protein